jgi:hypothetical protein
MLVGDCCSFPSPVLVPASPRRLVASWHPACHRFATFYRAHVCQAAHRREHDEHRGGTICSPHVMSHQMCIGSVMNDIVDTITAPSLTKNDVYSRAPRKAHVSTVTTGLDPSTRPLKRRTSLVSRPEAPYRGFPRPNISPARSIL